MIIYKYGLTKELTFRIMTCELVEEYASSYRVKDENNKSTYVDKDKLEVFDNKVMFSTSPDKKEEYFKKLIESANTTVENYNKKALETKARLEEILKINGYKLIN